MFLLAQTGVASVAGESLSHNGGGKDLIRFCFVKPEEKLDAACNCLQRLSPVERSIAAKTVY
jgi:aspartate/methionine/tyrosine aminotransferase